MVQGNHQRCSWYIAYNVKLADGHQRKVHLDHLRLREKEWGVIPSSDEEMPKASTFEQPENELDTSREMHEVSTRQHPSKGSARSYRHKPLWVVMHSRVKGSYHWQLPCQY